MELHVTLTLVAEFAAGIKSKNVLSNYWGLSYTCMSGN